MKTKLFIISICIAICFSCEDSEPEPQGLEVSTSDISLNSGESETIIAISDFDIFYESENEFHASVTSQGKVTAVKVGSTNIKVSSNGKVDYVPVEVIPVYETYPMPITDWNQSRSSIISVNGQPDAEMADGIGYEDYSVKAPMVLYLFDENGKLKSTAVMVKSEYSSELGSYIAERYQLLGEEDGVFFVMDALSPSEAEMGVVLGLYDLNYWMVLYMPYSDSAQKSSEVLISKFSEMKELVRKEMK